jgi:transposase
MEKTRRRWSVAEKRRIVELTLVAGASVARVAQAEGVNANQVFQWRRLHRDGELQACGSMALVPVVLRAEPDSGAELAPTNDAQAVSREVCSTPSSGSIRIELPGRGAINVERGADRGLLRTILESLCR